MSDPSATPHGPLPTFQHLVTRESHNGATADPRAHSDLELLASVVEQSTATVVITDTGGRILYVNPAFERTTGYSRDEALGQTPRLLKSGVQNPLTYAALWTTLMAGSVFRGTLVNRRKSGQFFSSGQTITPLRDRAGRVTHFVSVGRDVTEHEKAEEREVEMRLAGETQQRLHPREPRHPGLDVAGAAHPANATGGDYYDYLDMPGGRVGMVVADVSGHGFGAALMMVATRAALRSCLPLRLSLDEILDQVNATLLDDLEPHSFVTMLLASLDLGARTLTYSSAGHPTGYVLDRAGEIKSVLESTRIPLGIMSRWDALPVRTIAIEDGDILVLLTDGILESLGADGVAFGVENALALVRQHRHEPARRILDRLLEGAHAAAMGGPQLDDMTAVICKVHGSAAGTPGAA